MIANQDTNPKLDTRRIALFLGLAFGIAWLTGLVIYLTGGIANSPHLGTSAITLALVLMAVPYMGAPALAHILTRAITREGWKNVGLRPHFRTGWRFWLIGWVGPGLMTIAGAVLFFILFPQYFDSGLARLQQSLAGSPMARYSPWVVVGLETLLAIVISPIANSLATLGEEFGWRAYLLPKLLPLGWRKATLVLGAIWGVWHWPVIFMGYEYGFKYPGYPWVGPLLFMWITFCFGVFLAWLTLRAGSVWPAVIGHAAINGIAALAAIAVTGQPNPLLGPLPVGIIGALGYAVVALALFFAPGEKLKLAVEEKVAG